MKRNINIACGTDKNYLQHTAVMLCSLFENNKNFFFEVYIFTDAKRNITKEFSDFVNDYGHKVNIIVVDNDRFKKLPLRPGYPYAAYYPLFIPELLPKELEKIIFFDSDIVINKEISELWNINIDKKPIAAVRDYLVLKSPTQLSRLNNILKIKEYQYFNSGVLVFNLNLLRNDNFTEKCLCWAYENYNEIEHVDQDVMNAVIAGKWLRLPPKYNASYFLNDEDSCFSKIWSQSEVMEARKKSVVTHYLGHCKPWHYQCKYEVGKYLKYLKKTSWRDFKYKERNIFSFVEKHFANNYYIRKILSLIETTS